MDILKAIKSKECKEYAFKYSEQQYREFLEISPDGYMSDGLYMGRYDHLEDGIRNYLLGQGVDYDDIDKHMDFITEFAENLME